MLEWEGLRSNAASNTDATTVPIMNPAQLALHWLNQLQQSQRLSSLPLAAATTTLSTQWSNEFLKQLIAVKTDPRFRTLDITNSLDITMRNGFAGSLGKLLVYCINLDPTGIQINVNSAENYAVYSNLYQFI